MPTLGKKDKQKKFLELSANVILKSQNVVQIPETIAKIVLNKDDFSMLGYQYEDFVKIFIKLRNETFLKDLLFQETLKKSGFEADFLYSVKSGIERQKGRAEFKFYQTSLAILPEREELARIHFSDILDIKTRD
ncbi:MAG: hypothetical protein COY09_00655 [Candidatus Portnoybacteria bacterium CG_4_10_14_0_2_um_filter_39_11]|uniref:Uncharacterized protein n=1 Tax=Candidatus Portnoybacteria bacterium CG_4_10_14_0_2_um_filter_39_11 TaxID=1974797 RepID=A0A2M7UJJ7_9BACT|nr:MAG: hypothetical protein COY09_00655 [Candidatus Portnoybacteria bacterium CG_4_10_14_0_2_um_filter_39_11]